MTETATLDEAAFLQWLKEQGHRHPKPLPGGRYAAIFDFMFTEGIIVGRIGDRDQYDDRWCYERGKAEAALEAWDGTGEPQGWHRHPATGRRRPDGNADEEYLNP